MKKHAFFFAISIAAMLILLPWQKTSAQSLFAPSNSPTYFENGFMSYERGMSKADTDGDGVYELILSGFTNSPNYPAAMKMEPSVAGSITGTWSQTVNLYNLVSTNTNFGNDFRNLIVSDQNMDGKDEINVVNDWYEWDPVNGTHSRHQDYYEIDGTNWGTNFSIQNISPYMSSTDISTRTRHDFDGNGLMETVAIRNAKNSSTDSLEVLFFWDDDINQTIDSSIFKIYIPNGKSDQLSVNGSGQIAVSYYGPAVNIYDLVFNGSVPSLVLNQQITWPSSTGAGLSQMEWFDIDNDGDEDFVGFTWDERMHKALNDSGTLIIPSSHTMVLTMPYVSDLTVNDFDGDGYLDMGLVSGYGKSFLLFLNDQSNDFILHQTNYLSGNAENIESYDGDNDGDIDIYITGTSWPQMYIGNTWQSHAMLVIENKTFTTGIGSVDENNIGITVFANDRLEVLGKNRIEQVKVYDLAGRTIPIKTYRNDIYSWTVDIRDLRGGIYFASVADNKGKVSTKKILVNR